jgi:DNA-binding NarL/FixJ family response regulator
METVRALIVDDHPMFRRGLRTLLAALPEIAVIGEAGSGEEAVRLAGELHPDLVLMDLQMPGGSGLAATRTIVNADPHIRVLVVTLSADDDSVFAALRAGAQGYLLKEAEDEEMLRAVRAVAEGGVIFSPGIAARILSFFAAPQRSLPRDIFPELSEREREILGLIAKGHSTTDIAERLVLSRKTVSNYVSNIFSKLHVADRAQAIVRAREAGLGMDNGA